MITRLGLAALCWLAAAAPVFAHKVETAPSAPATSAPGVSGEPAWIQVAPDLSRPSGNLERRLFVGVFRASDGKPVDNAQVILQADMPTMPGLHAVPPTTFTPQGTPGVYQGSVKLAMSGGWIFRIKVTGPVVGIVDFLDQVGEKRTFGLLPVGGAGFRLRDTFNLAGRGLHLVGAAIWVGGLAFLSLLVARTPASVGAESSSVAPRWLLGLWHGGGLALILATGIYNLFFNTPPGRMVTVSDIQGMLVRPYGLPYTALLLFKLTCFVGLLGLGVWGMVRRPASRLWMALTVALGLVILAIGSALSYLHILIHGHSF
jgi:hypothetical protein